MNTEKSNDAADPLNELLKSWKVEAFLPPHFRQQVWRRIACVDEKSSWPVAGLLQRLAALGADLLRKPVGAIAYVSVLMAMGILAGVWSSDHYANQTEAAWRTAYSLAPDDPGFSAEYVVWMGQRIRWLEQED